MIKENKMKTMKRSEVLKLTNALGKIRTKYSGNLAYAILKNLNKLQVECSMIMEAFDNQKMSESFAEFENKRVDLVHKYAVKGENGEFEVSEGNYVLKPEYADIFKKEFDELSEEYKDAINQRKEQMSKLNDSLSEEVQVETYTIAAKYVEVMDAEDMDAISILIEGLD